MQQGFSFMEVFICLVLVSSSSVVVLKQYHAMHQTLQALCKEHTLIMLQDNAYERLE